MNGQIHKKSHITSINRLKLHPCSDESSDEELITCGHKDNTFTNPKFVSPKSSKRIDFIMYKLRDLCKSNACHGEPNGECASRLGSSTFISCFPEQIKINAKDLSGLSFSDHQPVASKVNFLYHLQSYEENQLEEGRNSDKNGSPIESSDIELDVHNGSEIKLNKSDSKSKRGSKLKQWKPSTPNTPSHQQLSLSQATHNNKPSDSTLLHDIENLLSDYVNGNTLAKYILTTGLTLLAIVIFLVLLYFTFDLTFIEMILILIILLMVGIFCLFLRSVTQRHEMHAVKAILNDISKKKSFGTEYGLLASH